MKNHGLAVFFGFVALSVLPGCSQPLDFCQLVTIEEVRALDNGVVSFAMEVQYADTAPTPTCVYRDNNGEMVFSIAIGDVLEHDPYEMLQVYGQLQEGDWKVVRVAGAARGGAALFSRDYDPDTFRLMSLSGREWSVASRARGVRNANDPKFEKVRKLTLDALTRFSE